MFPRSISKGSALSNFTFVRFASGQPLPQPPPLAEAPSPGSDSALKARKWVDQFRAFPATDLKDAKGSGIIMTFSRSSGPGGQNVNKVNTKATLRCPVDALWIPLWAKHELIKDPHYVSSTKTILLTSTVHRSQAQNIDDCLVKFQALILSAATAEFKNPTSTETHKRVENHIKAENLRKKAEKMHRSSIKKSRNRSSRDDWS